MGRKSGAELLPRTLDLSLTAVGRQQLTHKRDEFDRIIFAIHVPLRERVGSSVAWPRGDARPPYFVDAGCQAGRVYSGSAKVKIARPAAIDTCWRPSVR